MAGYGNPPTESQFKPGQSGNPAGKPRGAVSFATKLEQMFRDNPEQRDEILDKAVAEAKQGNFQYFAYIFDRMDGKMATTVQISDAAAAQLIMSHSWEFMESKGWITEDNFKELEAEYREFMVAKG